MKKTPRKIKQWALEAYDSLEKAIILFYEEYPNPSEEEKLELISFAVLFAAMNRGIDNKAVINKANTYILENLTRDFQAKEEDEPIYHSISFLLAYLDAHIAFGELSEGKADDIMAYLSENYQISIQI